jgi:hypothetical protein
VPLAGLRVWKCSRLNHELVKVGFVWLGVSDCGAMSGVALKALRVALAKVPDKVGVSDGTL